MERQVSFISHQASAGLKCCAVRAIQSATSPRTKHLACALLFYAVTVSMPTSIHSGLLFHAAQTKSSLSLRLYMYVYICRYTPP